MRPLIAVLLAVILTMQVGGLAVAAQPAAMPPALYLGILPEFREEIREETAEELTRYTIDVRLDTEDSTIAGDARVLFRNATPDTLTDVVFRLYPNGAHYDEGSLTIERALLDGEEARPRLDVEDTVLSLPLGEPLLPGDAAEIDLDFTVRVPTNSDGTFGVFSQDTADGTWVLADWYPIVAGYETGTGWRLDAPIAGVDATFSDAALYDVTFTAPTDLTVVATGTEVSATESGEEVRRRYLSGPVREFALVADDDYVVVTGQAGATTIRSYANPGAEAGAQAALAIAEDAVAAYSAHFGTYPYEELDLVDTPMAGALGVSWSGIVFINGNLVYDVPLYLNDPSRFEYLIAHEVGHQWWGGTVGANSNDHTFLTEGLTNAGFVTYLEAVHGPDKAEEELRAQVVDPYVSALTTIGDGVVDVPINQVTGGPPRGVLDYGKGAIGFLAIRVAIGDDAYLAALRDYADRYAFNVAEPRDLRRAFERAAGEQIDELWRVWFESAETTPADVEAVVAGL
ncbi:MAG: M1 family metallopeptidase [Thermomicrobiales bacterium]